MLCADRASCKLQQYILYFTMQLISCFRRKDLLLADVAIWVQYCVCSVKGHQGLDYSWLPGRSAIKWSRFLKISLPKWRCFGNSAETKLCGTLALEALFWWSCQYHWKWSGSSSGILVRPVNSYFHQVEFRLHEQCHRIRSMHSGFASCLRV